MNIDKLSILSNPKNLAKVRKKIISALTKAKFPKNQIYRIVLAVDEACANVIRHSYKNNYKRRINVKIHTAPNRFLKVVIRDYGIKPHPGKIKGIRPKNIKPGGLGVFFIRKIMDNVVYNLKKKKGTELTLLKKCK